MVTGKHYYDIDKVIPQFYIKWIANLSIVLNDSAYKLNTELFLHSL